MDNVCVSVLNYKYAGITMINCITYKTVCMYVTMMCTFYLILIDHYNISGIKN